MYVLLQVGLSSDIFAMLNVIRNRLDYSQARNVKLKFRFNGG